MVLGVAHEQLTSVPLFEAHELEQYVAKFTGTPGPTWDYQWVPVDGAKVVVITVDPPRQGDPIWLCMAADDRLHNVSIYVRVDGATRPANGAEVRLLGERTITSSAGAELDVSIVGGVVSAHCDPELLDAYIDKVRTRLLNAHAVTQGPLSGFADMAATIAVSTPPGQLQKYSLGTRALPHRSSGRSAAKTRLYSPISPSQIRDVLERHPRLALTVLG